MELQGNDQVGGELYLAHYNALTLQKADELALAGNYGQAEEIYNLMNFHNAYGISNELIIPRIRAAKALVEGKEVEESLQVIRELRETHGSSIFEEIEPSIAVISTNFFELSPYEIK